jgi:hypothetical protein
MKSDKTNCESSPAWDAQGDPANLAAAAADALEWLNIMRSYADRWRVQDSVVRYDRCREALRRLIDETKH